MAQSGDAFRKQHDIDDLKDVNTKDPVPPEDAGDEDIEGVETDIDKLHKEAFGDEDNKPIAEEIDSDEEGRIKDIVYEKPED